MAPGSNCVVNIAFKPTFFGSRVGTLTIASDSSPAAPVVSLAGTGVAAAPILSPTSISFGNVTVGGKAVSQTVQLKAVAPGPLSISSISVNTGFSQTNKCPATLNAGSSCSITVSFKPTVAGTFSGSLIIVDNGLGSPHSVPVSGTGVKKH